VVLLCGCDKTTPAQLMGAASADVPAIMVTGGPMLNGRWRGQDLGACTDCRRYETELRAGTITQETYDEIEDSLCRSAGHCNAGQEFAAAHLGSGVLTGHFNLPAASLRRPAP